MSQISELTLQQLKRAIAIRKKIEALQAQLDNLGDGAPTRKPGRPRRSTSLESMPQAKAVRKAKRVVSPEARAKMAAAQKARWAKAKA